MAVKGSHHLLIRENVLAPPDAGCSSLSPVEDVLCSSISDRLVIDEMIIGQRRWSGRPS